MSPDELKGKSPALFAGQKYYEMLIEAMKETQSANLNNDYVAWFQLLNQYHNWVRAFLPPKSNENLDALFKLVQPKVYILNDNLIRRSFPVIGYARFVREKLNEIERILYSANPEMFLKTSEGESDIDIDKLAGV